MHIKITTKQAQWIMSPSKSNHHSGSVNNFIPSSIILFESVQYLKV